MLCWWWLCVAVLFALSRRSATHLGGDTAARLGRRLRELMLRCHLSGRRLGLHVWRSGMFNAGAGSVAAPAGSVGVVVWGSGRSHARDCGWAGGVQVEGCSKLCAVRGAVHARTHAQPDYCCRQWREGHGSVMPGAVLRGAVCKVCRCSNVPGS
ncbi:hypothetical protein COO60DRAFT_1494243 [Scenedesmus sp. NREL 46B-D3]|nr:hypothetical protein COO60DRAFT_1494243 [Scenedesmus sp. NREL 46B-D3]